MAYGLKLKANGLWLKAARVPNLPSSRRTRDDPCVLQSLVSTKHHSSETPGYSMQEAW